MLPSRGQSWRHLRRRSRRRSHEGLGGRSCHPDLTIGLIVLLNIIPLQLQQPLPEPNPIDRGRGDLRPPLAGRPAALVYRNGEFELWATDVERKSEDD